MLRCSRTAYDIRLEVFNEESGAHIKILADADRRRILDFAMPWDSGSSLGNRIVVDAVLGPFPVKNAAIGLEVAN
jgi:hypothetical protein